MFTATCIIRQLLLVSKYIHNCWVHYVHPNRCACTKCTPWEFCLATGLGFSLLIRDLFKEEGADGVRFTPLGGCWAPWGFL